MAQLALSRSARRALAMIAGAAGLAGLGTAGIAHHLVRVVTRPQKDLVEFGYTFTPYEFGIPFEDVSFAPAAGAHQLHGWFLPRPESQRIVITSHGYRGRKADTLGISTYLWRHGFNVLVFDYHGHGAGLGTSITLAYREVHDLLGAIDWAAARIPGAAIGLLGYSMGASIAIMAAARHSLVQVVVADSPFATQRDILAEQLALAIHIPAWPFMGLVDRFMYQLAGHRFHNVEPIREVPTIAPRPLLLIHGLDDNVIQPSHSQRLYAAASDPKELWLVPNCGHSGAYFQDRPAYCARIADFFTHHLHEGKGEPQPPQPIAERRPI